MMRSVLALFVLPFTTILLPLAALATAVPGETGTLTFPVARSLGSIPLENVRLDIVDPPPWLEVLPESPLGPITLNAGDQFEFRIDYVVGPQAAYSGAGIFSVALRHDSPVAPSAKTWRIETHDALQTFRATCTDSNGVPCGERKAPDRTPPASWASYHGPVFHSSATVFVSTMTMIKLEASDPDSGFAKASGVAFIGTAFDQFVSMPAQLRRSSTSFLLSEDPYALFFAAVDRAGNFERDINVIDLRVDGSPPSTDLAIETSAIATGARVLVSARTTFRLDAVEVSSPVVASGVRETLLSLAGAEFEAWPSTFSLAAPDGPKELRWFSRDNVLNEEPIKSTTVVLDSTPPSLTLSCPAADSPDFCRIFDVAAPLRGSVHDPHLASWRLESAPGRSATEGFTLVSSGTTNIDGLLGTLDAASLSGFITLRLSAEDAVANASSLAVDVYAGDPARTFTLGGRKAFDKPFGLAVDASSRIYVADAGKDRVFVYAPDGSFLRSYGTDGRRETAFKQPSGVAVDGTGSVWVADTGNHRVVKLSAEGDVLALIGRHETKRGLKGFKPGKAPGEFKRPAAIAVDAAGQAYVADTGNRRIQVLGSDGSLLRVIATPPVPESSRHDEEDDDGESPRSLGVPVGVAVDGAGLIYVADRKGRRVLVLSPEGALLRTLPARFEQPWGVAVSSDGKCLAVSDRESGRIQRFDEEGRLLLEFQAAEKPLGLALADVLYAADSGKGQVLGFGLPVDSPVLASGEPPAQGKGNGFHTSSVASEEAPESVLVGVGRSGGAVLRSDRAGVEVPEGALDEELLLGVHAAEPSASRSERRQAAKLVEAGPAVEFAPHGLVFERPVAIRLPYVGPAAGLAVHHFDEDAGRWVALPTTFDEAAGLARAETSHFSVYQVLGPEAGRPAAPTVLVPAADAAFVFRDLYAFPNPARGSRRPTIRLQAGVADSVEVNVYDVSGERVHSAAFGPPVVLDDGNGKGPQWTYDHAWDASGVGSGVYIYVVTAKKAGHSDIRKSGRLAVIR